MSALRFLPYPRAGQRRRRTPPTTRVPVAGTSETNSPISSRRGGQKTRELGAVAKNLLDLVGKQNPRFFNDLA